MLKALLPPVPAALYVDFDNVVTKLSSEFAENPLAWVRWLEAAGHAPGGRKRRLLIKRVYWNSHNEVYRAAFEAAGFEAFACRSEARSKRSTADMVLALDAQESLYRGPPIQEYLLLSTDTDFVPLVDRLQDDDRRVISLVDERDVSSAVYRARADAVIPRHALNDAAQTPLEAYKVRRWIWGPITFGPVPLQDKPPRKVRRARERNEAAMAKAAAVVARDLTGRRVRRLEQERLSRLLSRIDGFTTVGADSDCWFGWGDELAFVDALAERDEALVATRSRRGHPQIELTEAVFHAARSGEAAGFDLEGAAEEIAKVAGERPGLVLNRARVTKLLAGFPTFTTSGARPFMGQHTYRNFVRAVVDLRSDLKLVPTPDGGVAVAARGVTPGTPSSGSAGPGRGQRHDGPDGDDCGAPLLAGGAAIVKG